MKPGSVDQGVVHMGTMVDMAEADEISKTAGTQSQGCSLSPRDQQGRSSA